MPMMNRRFRGEPVTRVIASVPTATVSAVNDLLWRTAGNHPARLCLAEFVRLAIAEKLERDRATVPENPAMVNRTRYRT